MLWIDRVRTNPFLRQLKHSDGSTEDVEISEIDSNITTTGTPLDSNNLNKIVCGDTQYGGTIVTNIDTINKSGYYTCYGTATGAPNTSYSWFIHHQNSNAGTASATQEAVAYSTTIYKYIRTKANSTWGDWIDLTSTLLSKIYPIGAIYMSVNNASPATFLGGTWVAWGTGRVPVGIDTSQAEFNSIEKTGGEKAHTLTVAEMPEHNHKIPISSYVKSDSQTDVKTGGHASYKTEGINYDTTSAGGLQPHNNVQPYIVCYMWKRTA